MGILASEVVYGIKMIQRRDGVLSSVNVAFPHLGHLDPALSAEDSQNTDLRYEFYCSMYKTTRPCSLHTSALFPCQTFKNVHKHI